MKSHKRILLPLLLIAFCISFLFPQQLQAASKVKLSKTKVTLKVGKSTTIKVKNTKKKVRWSTSNKKVATVKKGKITGKASGTATVTAKVGKKAYKCKVTVQPTKKSVSPYYNKLKRAILNSPDTHADGNKALRITETMDESLTDDLSVTGTVTMYAVYEQAKNRFRFELFAESAEFTATTTFWLDPNTACSKKQPVQFVCVATDPTSGESDSLSGTSKMNILSYQLDTSLPFVYANTVSLTAEEKELLDLLPDLYTMLTVVGSDSLITEKAGVTLQQLGFCALSYQ